MGRILYLQKERRAQSSGPYYLQDESGVALFGTQTGAVQRVTSDNCELISAVFCAITVLTNAVARLPLIIYKRTEDGKERADNVLVADLFRRAPNPWTTPFELKEMIVGHLILRGDFFAQKYASRNGSLILIPLHPDRISVSADPDFGLTYQYQDAKGKITFPQDEIFHVKGLRSDGLRGRSVISNASLGLYRSAAGDQYATDFFENSATPSGLLMYPQKLDDLEYKNIRDSWRERHAGAGNRHNVAILEQGLQWQQLGISNTDAQILESRQFEITEVARWFNLPPHKLKDLSRSTFSNIEHQSREFHEDSVLPWATRIQEHINRCFFGRDNKYFSEFLYDSILITDTLQRYQAHGLAITNGWKTRNEVRALENLNDLDGLDDTLVPLNMAGASDVTPKEPDTKKRVEQAFRRLFEDAFQRIVTAEVKNLERCLKKPNFMEEIGIFYTKHAEFCRNILRPITESFSEASMELPDDYLAHAVRSHIEISTDKILNIVGTKDWQTDIEHLCESWSDSRARIAADKFLGDLKDGTENDSGINRRRVAGGCSTGSGRVCCSL